MLVAFDAYRDQEARDAMISFVMAQRTLDKPRAVSELRGLNHVGLAHVYRDALAAGGRANRVDYDPCEALRL